MSEHNKYYEQRSFWGKDFNSIPAESQRLLATRNLIPQDVESILDVGCGNGAFLNSLPSSYITIGTDLSQEALRYARVKVVRSDISALPFPDRSFDLVTCLEVLEHLPHKAFTDTLDQIARITRKYVIISVPNNQNLELSLVTCPSCRCRFNANYHVRSFSASFLKTEPLFPGSRFVQLVEIGPMIPAPRYNLFVATVYQAMIKNTLPQHAICPQCGYQESEPAYDEKGKQSAYRGKDRHRRGIFRVMLWPFRIAAKVIWPSRKQHRWISALYKVT
jgi:SAM-dependent methyltransferase